jgi:nicotinate dehydrogenase subunit B
MMIRTRMTRRQFFGKLGEGSLVVGFSLSPVAASMLAREAQAARVDSQLTVLSGIPSGSPPANDAWLTIDHQGNITLFSGKVELGTGTQTAFSQIVGVTIAVRVERPATFPALIVRFKARALRIAPSTSSMAGSA